MKERPILFSDAMVSAIIDGRKSQTRRVITRRGPDFHSRARFHCLKGGVATFGDSIPDDPVPIEVRCPYGGIGSQLWVREAWFPDPPDDGSWAYMQWAGGRHRACDVPERFRTPEFCLYRSTWDGIDLRWRPSIHMPRWASRITLELTEVRVQRLQDISLDDCEAEGVVFPESARSVANFAQLWGSINAERGFGWSVNPWVWALTFKIVK